VPPGVQAGVPPGGNIGHFFPDVPAPREPAMTRLSAAVLQSSAVCRGDLPFAVPASAASIPVGAEHELRSSPSTVVTMRI
jgi:hypothetical protein